MCITETSPLQSDLRPFPTVTLEISVWSKHILHNIEKGPYQLTNIMPPSTSRLGLSQDHYISQLDGHRQYENAPWGILEHQLQESVLGDCSGMTVLDLGGGQGLRARQAIDHGAIAVDVVDSTRTFSISQACLLYNFPLPDPVGLSLS